MYKRPYEDPYHSHYASASTASASTSGTSPSGVLDDVGMGDSNYTFTRAQRDRQARGKDPYAAVSDDSDSEVHFAQQAGSKMYLRSTGRSRVGEGSQQWQQRGTSGSGQRYGQAPLPAGGYQPAYRAGGFGKGDPYAAQERRERAAAFLDSHELLMMYAQSQGDSIPAARYHFSRMLCGIEDEDDMAARTAAGPSASSESPRTYAGGSGNASSSSAKRGAGRREAEKRRVSGRTVP